MALLGVGLLPWAPLLLGRALLQRDLLRLVWPARAFFGQSLRSGHFPLWYPSIGLGLSAFADPQLGVFYPPHLLFALCDGPVAVTAMSLLHLLFGACGMFLLARALGARGVGAFIAGMAWQAAGFTLSESTAGFRSLAEAYLPWMALSFLQLARAKRASAWTAGAGLLVALAFLVGEYFMAFLALVFAGLFALAIVLAEAQPGQRRRAALRTLLRVGSAGGLGVYAAASAQVETDKADLFAEDILTGRAVILPAPLPQPLASEPGQAGTCEMTAFSANQLSALCRPGRPGVVVFVEQYARGWQAALDGRPVPVLRTNSVMRAVWAPAGEHRIELNFHAPGLGLGAIISILAGVVLLLSLRLRRPSKT